LDLTLNLAKVRFLESDLAALRKFQEAFAIRTKNEIDFARGDARGRHSKKQACAAKAAICPWREM
jgi:hypothetical protein